MFMKKIYSSLFLFFAIGAKAQIFTTMEPVNISNSRSLQKNSVTGKNITVVEGALFEKLPVVSLDEFLKYIPGIEIQQRGPAGAQADIIIRGGTFQQVLVLIDGVKINDPITGHFSGYMPVTPSEIERIEIIKGPAAAMYGSEAVGGIVNIISKTAFSYKKVKKQRLSVGVTGGEFGLINAHAHLYGTGEKLNYSIGVLSNNASGQLLRSNNRGYFYNQTFSGSIVKQFNNQWQLFLQSSFDNRDFAAQNFYTPFLSDTAEEKVTTFWNHGQLKKNGNSSSEQIDAVYKNTFDNYAFNNSSTSNKNR
ncbi:MAG: TonB-dependent receptor, partial [Ferruginibacter sp.]|nr:TonB-dependent receptor [Ferruginibacter sp.]